MLRKKASGIPFLKNLVFSTEAGAQFPPVEILSKPDLS